MLIYSLQCFITEYTESCRKYVFVREALRAAFQFQHHTSVLYHILRNECSDKALYLEPNAACLQKNTFNSINLNLPAFTADLIQSIVLNQVLSIPRFCLWRSKSSRLKFKKQTSKCQQRAFVVCTYTEAHACVKTHIHVPHHLRLSVVQECYRVCDILRC